MPKTLANGDKWMMAVRTRVGEMISLNCEVGDNGTVMARIDGSMAVVRVYTVDSAIIGQYVDTYTVRAVVSRTMLLFTREDVTTLIALVLSVVEEAPGVEVIPNPIVDALDFNEPLF